MERVYNSHFLTFFSTSLEEIHFTKNVFPNTIMPFVKYNNKSIKQDIKSILEVS